MSWAVALLLVVLAGCGPGPVIRHGVVNETAMSALQERVAAIRGLTFDGPVPSRALPPEGISDVLTEELDHGFPAADLAVIETVYGRLNLLDAGTTLRPALQTFYEGQVAAFYDPRRKELTVATDALSDDSLALGVASTVTGRDPVGELIVAHEMVHALQDQHWGMPTEPEPVTASDSDRLVARRAVLEGDATLASFAVLQNGQLDDDMRARILEELAPLSTRLAENYPDVPAIIRETLAFQYQAGLIFTGRALDDGGWAGVDAVQADPPASTEQVLHPERYFDRRDEPTLVAFPAHGPLERSSHRLILCDTLGELNVRVLARRTLPDAQAVRVAEGWDGDRLGAWRRGDQVVVAWMTVWDSAADAEEFAEAALTMVPGARIEQRDTRVLVLVGSEWPRLASALFDTTRIESR